MIHLTRKWRPKSFDEIVGQKLTVRLLKNSLYKDHVFPVYLLSGVRGSGKTTTGRVFAAALNCSCLKKFQDDPQKTTIPCVDQCDSCKAMRDGNHPDFIEIDAASHTGVDHVRHIIETASFLPTLGTKKVYLIDEAHMLSKAAFNAFLKILEEPPASAVFLLATTDPHKILPTVRSRCFQLFFDALPVADIVGHLEQICQHEAIAYEQQGLVLIAQETDGCVRDAMNLLERVRFSAGGVSAQTVMRVLGDLSDQVLVQLFSYIAHGQVQELMSTLHSLMDKNFSPVRFWNKMVSVIRQWLYCSHGVTTGSLEGVRDASALFSPELLVKFLEYLYACEASFVKTTQQRVMTEMVMLKFVHLVEKYQGRRSFVEPNVAPKVSTAPEQPKAPVELDQKKVVTQSKSAARVQCSDERWGKFLDACVESVKDKLLLTVFQQGIFVSCDSKGIVEVHFPKKFAFYKDVIQEQKETWLPCLERMFEVGVTFVPKFILDSDSPKKVVSVASEPQKSAEVKKKVQTPVRKVGMKKRVYAREQVLDVADKESWPQTNALLRVFPGKVVQVQEGSL